MSITVTIETNREKFNASLSRYIAETGKSTDEVLEKKGRDLGIRLFRGFRDRKWGGAGKSPRIATAELAARTSEGKGTKVRDSLMARYRRERASFNFFARSLGQQRRRFGGTLDQFSRIKQQQEANRRQRAGLWRAIVGREIGLRQSGIGVLAASFLWYRRRSNQARGTFLVKNRTGKPLGSVQKSPGALRIMGFPPGLDKVSQRYGVVNRAIVEANADTEVYLARKEIERYKKTFAGLGRLVA